MRLTGEVQEMKLEGAMTHFLDWVRQHHTSEPRLNV